MSARERMQTALERLDVDLVNHVAVVHMHEHTCTDMTGCISVVTEIDPDCELIVTVAGSVIDTSYRRTQPGVWRAVCARASMR